MRMIEAVVQVWSKLTMQMIPSCLIFSFALGMFCNNAGAQQSGNSPAFGRPFPASPYVNPESKTQKLFSKEAVQPTGISRSPAESLSAAANPIEAAAEPDVRNYTLTESDLISVKVYQEPDLDAVLRVAKDGTVNYWLLGPVRVAGKSLQEATRQIRDLLGKDYLVNPQVNVTIVEYARREFTILGEVQRPGTYEIRENKPLTLQQAIALAGGYKPSAKKGRVTVTRWVNGQKSVQKVNTDALAKDRDSKPFIILPDDHITVDESFF